MSHSGQKQNKNFFSPSNLKQGYLTYKQRDKSKAMAIYKFNVCSMMNRAKCGVYQMDSDTVIP